ncbi:hypothetical protein DFH08DRAFT_803393 [Mycena albidolilacea]|uniref:Uncharacterized protein n=1 Tax=Mycena albidolilacea TaxID=1033008 RepID=A0AAD7ACT0_9AGAR|nr:hypothetical protein DFH08DRAFT_803393 [Mycena albidolilacea]
MSQVGQNRDRESMPSPQGSAPESRGTRTKNPLHNVEKVNYWAAGDSILSASAPLPFWDEHRPLPTACQTSATNPSRSPNSTQPYTVPFRPRSDTAWSQFHTDMPESEPSGAALLLANAHSMWRLRVPRAREIHDQHLWLETLGQKHRKSVADKAFGTRAISGRKVKEGTPNLLPAWQAPSSTGSVKLCPAPPPPPVFSTTQPTCKMQCKRCNASVFSSFHGLVQICLPNGTVAAACATHHGKKPLAKRCCKSNSQDGKGAEAEICNCWGQTHCRNGPVHVPKGKFQI